MKSSADVVIVGGGIVGLATAYNLAALGHSNVVVLESGYLGGGATGRCGEGIRAQFNAEPNIRIAMESEEIFERLTTELHYNILYHRTGYLFLAFSERELELCKDNVASENRVGVGSRLISPREAREIVPLLNIQGVLGAQWYEKDGSAHHDATVAAYAQRARKLGVNIYPFTEAKSIRVENGSKVVSTTHGEVKAPVVVAAGGAWTKTIASWVSVDLRDYPVRHEILVTESLKPCLRPMLVSLRSKLYCRQTMRGEIVGGVGNPEEKSSYNMRSSFRFLQLFARELTQLIPAFKAIRVIRQWAGLYDMSPDGSPIIGEADEVPGFYVACGWSGHGFMIAPAVGKALAEAIVTGKTPSLIEPFHPRRFREGKPLYERTVLG